MPFDEKYFSTHTYQDVSFARFHQYWWSNRFYARLARRYGRKGRLLEIGSGLGHLVAQLEGFFSTVALDVNPWALGQSRHVAPRTLHAAGNAQALPFPRGCFETVIIKHVVEHLPDPAAAIAELGRVLAPGGCLVLSTPNLASLLKPWKGQAWIGYQDPTHIALKEPGEWLGLLRAAGFTIRHVFSDGFWDAPYIRGLPKMLQKVLFGSLGGLQALMGVAFLPMRWGESIIVIAGKNGNEDRS